MALFEITVRGSLGPRVAAALGDVTARTDGDRTVLSGEWESEALGAFLARIRDLHLELIDVMRLSATEPQGPAA